MKLYFKEDCGMCKSVHYNDLNVELIYVDKNYNGFIPPMVPILQFDNGVQIPDANTINAIFSEIRKNKK